VTVLDAMAVPTRRYRIEENLRAAAPAAPEAVGPSASDGRIGEILATVQDLKKFFDPNQQRMAGDVVEAYRREISEVYKLRSELDSMKEAITSTKSEIATLYRSEYEGKGMRRVAGELDAVVDATEQATTSILAAVEEIESAANMLRASGVESGNNDHLGVILERVVGLYESCNFQDLTGQRITKIVGVLKFVEERLDRMIGVWGGLDAFKDLVEQDNGQTGSSEKDLINGPKLESDAGHVDQTDIDALFD
jgi:chemotaxis protein CheZ